jgi:hypothetical protein
LWAPRNAKALKGPAAASEGISALSQNVEHVAVFRSSQHVHE